MVTEHFAMQSVAIFIVMLNVIVLSVVAPLQVYFTTVKSFVVASSKNIFFVLFEETR
jgi:hypothetical protein